jgi:hypothetical protein
MKTAWQIPLFIVLASFFFAGCPFTLPKDLVDLNHLQTCPPWDMDKLYHEAQSFDHSTDNLTLQCALAAIRNALPDQIHKTPTGARICYLLADRTTNHQGQREQYAAEGIRWAEIALSEGAAEEGAVRYYLGVNLGLAVQEHVTLAIQNMKRLFNELRKSRILASHVDSGGPLRALGMLYLRAPSLALELLSEVTQRFPGHPLNHLFYAQALWELEEDDAINKVRQHLIQARDLFAQEDWKLLGNRWNSEIEDIVEEAEISLD